jgi:hypothetical protein
MFSAFRDAVLAAIAGGLFIALSTDAAATVLDVLFISDVGSATPTGSFTYDGATQKFSNFVAHFGNQVLDSPARRISGSSSDCPETPSNAVGGFTGTVRECVLTGEEGIVDGSVSDQARRLLIPSRNGYDLRR